MRATTLAIGAALSSSLSVALAACGNTADDTNGSGGSGTSVSGSAGSGVATGGSSQGGATSGGSPSTGGATTGGSSTGGASTGGTGGSTAGTSGAAGSAGSATGGAGGGSGSCAMGAWPAVDPAMPGPFATMTETNVGPAAGEGADGGAPVAFTMFRPMNLAESGLCHPVVTWGNGTGSTPSLYGVFLRHLASHGFVVIASDSPQVSRGDPPPMVAGVTWVIQQNDDPMSPLYRRIDTAHVGATGHSQGGFATTQAAGDAQITTMAPLCGASQQRNLHGPAFFFCGGEDTVVECDGIQNAYNAVTTQPAMFANHLASDHADWVTFRGTTLSPVEVATTAWMRVQLMNDTALRSWFYGPSCRLCTDTAWEILQKNMEQ